MFLFLASISFFEFAILKLELRVPPYHHNFPSYNTPNELPS